MATRESHEWMKRRRVRSSLISKLQDVYHYLLAATGEHDADGRESTFDHGRLVERIRCYDSGRVAYIDAHDLAEDSADEAGEEQRRTVLDSAISQDFRDEGEMRAAARNLLDVLRGWCSTIQVDPYQCLDLRDKKYH